MDPHLNTAASLGRNEQFSARTSTCHGAWIPRTEASQKTFSSPTTSNVKPYYRRCRRVSPECRVMTIPRSRAIAMSLVVSQAPWFLMTPPSPPAARWSCSARRSASATRTTCSPRPRTARIHMGMLSGSAVCSTISSTSARTPSGSRSSVGARAGGPARPFGGGGTSPPRSRCGRTSRKRTPRDSGSPCASAPARLRAASAGVWSAFPTRLGGHCRVRFTPAVELLGHKHLGEIQGQALLDRTQPMEELAVEACDEESTFPGDLRRTSRSAPTNRRATHPGGRPPARALPRTSR